MEKFSVEVTADIRDRLNSYQKEGVSNELSSLNKLREYLIEQWVNCEIEDNQAKDYIIMLDNIKCLYRDLAEK